MKQTNDDPSWRRSEDADRQLLRHRRRQIWICNLLLWSYQTASLGCHAWVTRAPSSTSSNQRFHRPTTTCPYDRGHPRCHRPGAAATRLRVAAAPPPPTQRAAPLPPPHNDTELRDAIALIATHPEQKLPVRGPDRIGGSINVTRIEFLEPVPRAAEADWMADGTASDAAAAVEAAAASSPPTLRSLWRRRGARSAAEGIRREKTGQLSDLLARAEGGASGRRYGARTIMGLIHALAEEAADLDVEVDARRDTPLWGKQVDAIRIRFSRLGFKPLRMGGLDRAFHEYKMMFPDTAQGAFHMDRQLYDLSCADEAFERIDVDNSGALDRDELANALVMAARTSDETELRKLKVILRGLASELVNLYDFNGDGVVDRSEYQTLVEDMASLKEMREMEQKEQDERVRVEREKNNWSYFGWLMPIKELFQGLLSRNSTAEVINEPGGLSEAVDAVGTVRDHVTLGTDSDTSEVLRINGDAKTPTNGEKSSLRLGPESFDWADGYSSRNSRVSEVSDEALSSLMAKDLGSITISDLKLDLRRLLFGAIPFIKHITPGGPLILEPFTTTITASFNSYDIKNSFLLDAGLRRLVAQAIRRRVRSLRDTIDGAVFYGRSWKMSSKSAPVVEVIAIEDVEFDSVNRMILTGRVRVQTAPDQPMVENAFKLRARLGTNAAGRRIRLVEPELALVLECPKAWERTLGGFFDFFGISGRQRPKPLYFFFPIYSPFKLEDPENDGFDLGEDNQIKSIYIKDDALRFELSAVLRPGRFLGNHYLAFTVPNRTFIITLDRVKEGIRAARKMKQATKAVEEATAKKRPKLPLELRRLREIKQAQLKRVRPKSFFSRFVDGYTQIDRDEIGSERVTKAIRDFFGRQSLSRDRQKISTDKRNGADRVDSDDELSDDEAFV